MRIALLSDIHSNCFALKKVLQFLEDKQIDHFLLLGDSFGYFPWARETWELINSLAPNMTAILGNHDELIIREESPNPLPDYWMPIESNKRDLPEEALRWLKSLNSSKSIVLDGIEFELAHGTPEDSLNGRYYPDNDKVYDWFPKENQILVLGHTHYPLIKKVNGGTIVNPGSVGQPRDGILESSCCIFDTNSGIFTNHRIAYDVNHCIELLQEMNWYPHAIKTLQKKKA
ncbi:MAG: metallophosphoesterase family protein [Flavobacteriales bacterium]